MALAQEKATSLFKKLKHKMRLWETYTPLLVPMNRDGVYPTQNGWIYEVGVRLYNSWR